jgi:hypothetical protein
LRLSSAAHAATRSSNVDFVSSMSVDNRPLGGASPAGSQRDRSRARADNVEPKRLASLRGSIVTTTAPAPARLRPQDRRNGRLADAAGAAADDDVTVLHDVAERDAFAHETVTHLTMRGQPRPAPGTCRLPPISGGRLGREEERQAQSAAEPRQAIGLLRST